MVSRLVLKGYREKLTKDDRLHLNDQDKSGPVIRLFQHVWDKKVKAVTRKYSSTLKTTQTDGNVGIVQPNLAICLFKAFRRCILIDALFSICFDVMTLCTPYILK